MVLRWHCQVAQPGPYNRCALALQTSATAGILYVNVCGGKCVCVCVCVCVCEYVYLICVCVYVNVIGNVLVSSPVPCPKAVKRWSSELYPLGSVHQDEKGFVNK